MNKTDYTVKEEKDGMVVEKYLMEYSEEDIQNNKVNKQNASNIWQPEFIHIYMEERKQFDLSPNASLLYGFIRFAKGRGSGRFFFSNEQLASVLDCSISGVNKAIKELKEKGLIVVGRSVKSGGGTLRWVNKVWKFLEVPKWAFQKHPNGYLLINNKSIKEKKGIVHQNKFDVVSSLFGISKQQIEEWFEHKKSLDRIIYLCEAIEEISTYGGIEPVWNKDTINTTDILLKSFKIEDIKEYCEFNDVFELSENYQELVRNDYYLPYLMDI